MEEAAAIGREAACGRVVKRGMRRVWAMEVEEWLVNHGWLEAHEGWGHDGRRG